MAYGQVFALLGRSGVANIGEHVGFNASVAEQRVAFGRGTVGGYCFAGAALIDEVLVFLNMAAVHRLIPEKLGVISG